MTSVIHFRAGGQACEAIVPDDRSSTVVFYHHGSGESEAAWRSDSGKAGIRASLLAAGHLIVSSYAAGNNWGNQASIDAVEAMWRYVQRRFPYRQTVVHLSQSMGGLCGLSVVAGSTVPSHGWAGIYPACDLADMYDTYLSAQIETAYGFSGGANYAAATSGYDPVLLSGSAFTGVRMRFYASPDDTVVNKTANSDAMATLVNGQATENEVVVCSGDHGDASHFQPADLLSFISRCG